MTIRRRAVSVECGESGGGFRPGRSGGAVFVGGRNGNEACRAVHVHLGSIGDVVNTMCCHYGRQAERASDDGSVGLRTAT
jgi:hypothetical protein